VKLDAADLAREAVEELVAVVDLLGAIELEDRARHEGP
jgi:hypothetical protein